MTKYETKILNTIENGMNQLRDNYDSSIMLDTENGFQIMITRDTISLWDSPEIAVLMCDRGYLQLSQIIPLIADIIRPYGK